MITKNCVFVVGAGASKVYGLPSGNDLMNSILGSLNNPDEILLRSFERDYIDLFYKSLAAFNEIKRKYFGNNPNFSFHPSYNCEEFLDNLDRSTFNN